MEIKALQSGSQSKDAFEPDSVKSAWRLPVNC